MTQGKRLLALVCGLLVVAGISGCYPDRQTVSRATPFRSNMWQRHSFDYTVHRLRQHGVQVIRVGDTTRLIIPSDNFFKINSAEFGPRAHATLSWVTQLVEKCGCHRILITAHVDNVFKAGHRETLATRQARAVKAELWANGIDLSRLFAKGCSNRAQIATDRTVFGSGDNRRIEINLE